MTTRELRAEMARLTFAQRRAYEQLGVFARALVMTLKDAGREHSAKELERLLFTLDALDGEMNALIEANAPNLLRGLIEDLER